MILAYIDPGTGSMLFSVAMGLATAAFFAVKFAWIRLKSAVAGRGAATAAASARRERIVIYSEGARYWNVFKPVVEELERRGVEAVFMTSEEGDPAFRCGLSRVRPQFIGAGNAAYARLNLLEADVCLMTTPGLDVYQLKRSKGVRHYAHILHAVDDATSYRLFGLDYFDSVLLSGGYQAKAIRELEAKRRLPPKELRVVGSTYLDAYAAKARGLPPRADAGATVLVSPSWGASGILLRYGMELLGPLAESGLRIIVRPHPQSFISEKQALGDLKRRLEPFPRVEWDPSPENLASLSRSDVMISDFSGIVFDYAFLFGRPIFYAKGEFDPRPYDASDVEGTPWKFAVLPRIGKELRRADFPRIAEAIASLRADPAVSAAIEAARDEAWQFRGESGARVVDLLLEHA